MDKHNEKKSESTENPFFQRLSQENIMSNGMLTEIDQTDLINLQLAEESAKRSINAGQKPKDLAP